MQDPQSRFIFSSGSTRVYLEGSRAEFMPRSSPIVVIDVLHGLFFARGIGDLKERKGRYREARRRGGRACQKLESR